MLPPNSVMGIPLLERDGWIDVTVEKGRLERERQRERGRPSIFLLFAMLAGQHHLGSICPLLTARYLLTGPGDGAQLVH